MKFYKKLINGIGNNEHLKLLPNKQMVRFASLLIIETKDSYIVVKNRWSDLSLGNFYTNRMNHLTPIEDLDYRVIDGSQWDYDCLELFKEICLESANIMFRI